VPSNDFGNQEPESETTIQNFCTLNFNVNFPMTVKTNVRGYGAHPFYKWAANQLGVLAKPRWNFHKYLVGPDGSLVDWFAPSTSPNSKKIKTAIIKALASSK